MKKFKNNLSRTEMKTIFAGGGTGPAPIGIYCKPNTGCNGHGGCSDSDDGRTFYCTSCCLA